MDCWYSKQPWFYSNLYIRTDIQPSVFCKSHMYVVMPQLASDQWEKKLCFTAHMYVPSRHLAGCLGDRWFILGAKPRVNLFPWNDLFNCSRIWIKSSLYALKWVTLDPGLVLLLSFQNILGCWKLVLLSCRFSSFRRAKEKLAKALPAEKWSLLSVLFAALVRGRWKFWKSAKCSPGLKNKHIMSTDPH